MGVWSGELSKLKPFSAVTPNQIQTSLTVKNSLVFHFSQKLITICNFQKSSQINVCKYRRCWPWLTDAVSTDAIISVTYRKASIWKLEQEVVLVQNSQHRKMWKINIWKKKKKQEKNKRPSNSFKSNSKCVIINTEYKNIHDYIIHACYCWM